MRIYCYIKYYSVMFTVGRSVKLTSRFQSINVINKHGTVLCSKIQGGIVRTYIMPTHIQASNGSSATHESMNY